MVSEIDVFALAVGLLVLFLLFAIALTWYKKKYCGVVFTSTEIYRGFVIGLLIPLLYLIVFVSLGALLH